MMNEQTVNIFRLRIFWDKSSIAMIFAAVLGALIVLTACQPPPVQPEDPPLKGARIGGSFTLVDHTGTERRDSDFSGYYRLVYFGYSFCPDVCPLDLQKLMQGLAQFEESHSERGKNIVPMFITIDPERDTSEVLASFVERYHPRLLGLTGSAEQIAATAKAFLVYYEKQQGSAPERYLMAHSQLAYLLGPQGEPLALLPVDDLATPADEGSPRAVAAELERWVR